MLGQVTPILESVTSITNVQDENMMLFQREVTMENRPEVEVETRKEWIAPELKKIDLEQLTAGTALAGDNDGAGGWDS